MAHGGIEESDAVPYQQIVECTNDGIWLLDKDGKTRFVNPRMSEFLGYTPEELMGRRPTEFMDPEMAAMVTERIRTRKAGVKETYEARYRRKDGSDLWVSTSAAPLRSASGDFKGSLGVHKDITEKKHIEKAIEAQNAKLIASSKMSALGEMAGGIAHEINNPLAVILMLSSQLSEWVESGDPVDPEYLKQTLRSIGNTSQRIAKIVEGLRAFSRDGTNDPFQLTTLNTIIQDTLNLCHERFKGKAVALSVNAVADDLAIECKPTQISQILLNLLNNAFDAVQALPEKWVRVETVDQPEWIEIHVVDSGSGVPAETRGKIFNPFFTTKGVGKGTGLGLSISKGIVESHQGSLVLDDRSENTRFKVILPKKRREASQSP